MSSAAGEASLLVGAGTTSRSPENSAAPSLRKSNARFRWENSDNTVMQSWAGISFSSFSWKRFFFILSGAMLLVMLVASFDYGITWDEFIQSHYGKLVLRYLATGGADQTCLVYPASMYLYGGLFDSLAVLAYGLFSGKLHEMIFYNVRQNFFQDGQLLYYFETRHALNAFFGFLAIFYTGLTAKELKGWKTACLASIMLFFSPRFFGNAMNNPKDIPFAAAAAFSLYFMVRYIRELPRPALSTRLAIAAGIAAAINIKVGGVLFIGYFFLFAIGAWALDQKSRAPLKLLRDLLLIAIVAYLGGLLFWPYGQRNPLINPFKALTVFSSFTDAQGKMLFDGAQILQNQAPWYYLPKWILISSPFFFITGLFLFFMTARTLARNCPVKILVMLAFAGLFPVAYAILRKSVVYDSWRHFLFIYPPLVILAAAAWEQAFNFAQRNSHKIIVGLFFAFQFSHPVQWMLAHHPNAYVYFNPAAGGIQGAFGRYETDYWGNCLRQASEWLSHHYLEGKPATPARIQADGDVMSSSYYLIRRLGPLYRPAPKGSAWDYRLALSRGLGPKELLGGQWPPPGTIHRIQAEGVTLCAVVQNPEFKEVSKKS